MAFVFICLFAVCLIGFRAAWRMRAASLLAAGGRAALLAAFGVVLAYLVVKALYEELYPCVFVDRRYCDFATTQYWNLFGWNF